MQPTTQDNKNKQTKAKIVSKHEDTKDNDRHDNF